MSLIPSLLALAVLAAGDLAFTAHGSAAVAADPLEALSHLASSAERDDE